jgi:hypothetical protein
MYALHVTCEKLDFLPRKEQASKIPSPHMAIAHQSRGASVVKVSHVRGTLSSRILETNNGRGISVMQIVGEL